MSSSKRAYFTICSLNYLAYALTLHESLVAVDVESASNFSLILVDEPEDPHLLDELPFEVILAKDLDIPTFWDMAMRYSIMEFNTAVKPAAFKHLIRVRGYSQVIYLDPDIFVVKELAHVHEVLDKGAEIVLTPHTTEPLEDGFDPGDLRIMQTGVYNLGFFACRQSASTDKLLDWWDRRMVADCRVDLQNGIFVDQKFMDLAPAFCEAAHILHHPGYNIAYWNLPSRSVQNVGNDWLVNDVHAHFFHFSGVNADDPSVFSKHQNRYSPDDIGSLKSLFLDYLAALTSHRHTEWSKLHYRYSSFDDGASIPAIYRTIYQKYVAPCESDYLSVFTANYDLLNAPSDDVDQEPDLPISRVMLEIWNQRPDLQLTFPISNRQGREAMTRWFIASATSEYGIPETAIDGQKRKLEQNSQPLPSVTPGSRISKLKRRISRIALSLSPAIRPIYRSLPMSWRIKARDGLLISASQPSYASMFKSDTKRSYDKSLKPGVDVYGYFSTVSGVGEGARRMARALSSADVSHQTIEINRDGHLAHSPSTGPNRHKIALFHINADQTPRVLDNIGPSTLKGQYRIGYWAWEVEKFPSAWMLAFDYLDEIWVPSEFVRQSISKVTAKPVVVVPHPVTPVANMAFPKSIALPDDRFVFLCAIDLRSFEARKNPRGMVEAFRRAFPEQSDTDPVLAIKLSGGKVYAAARKALDTLIEADENIIVIDSTLSDDDWSALKANCDAFLSLHRSEGFGLSIAEMLAIGKPVIATNYGGNTDYLSEETGYLVNFSMAEIRPGEYPESAGEYWAEPDIDHAASIIRKIATEPLDLSRTANGKALMERSYSSSAIADRINNRLTELSTTLSQQK